MKLDELLKKRASVKKFSVKKPPANKIIEAIYAAETAPSAGNIQNIIYIVIDNPDTIAEIAKACQQDFIRKAPWVVVITSNPKQLKKLYDVRADKYQKHYVGAAVENILLKLVDMGLASCWVGAFSEPTIRNLLEIPDDQDIELILPIGYELKPGKTSQRPKYSIVNRLFFGGWGNKFYKPINKIRRGDI
jgi:nitroreductase